MPGPCLKPNICLVPALELFMSMCETSVLHRTALRCCRELGAKGIKSMLTVPISFVSEHIETLEEIDMEYRELAVSVEVPVGKVSGSAWNMGCKRRGSHWAKGREDVRGGIGKACIRAAAHEDLLLSTC